VKERKRATTPTPFKIFNEFRKGLRRLQPIFNLLIGDFLLEPVASLLGSSNLERIPEGVLLSKGEKSIFLGGEVPF
jgi:hypothetical protein